MKSKFIFFALLVAGFCRAQIPMFGPDKLVTITGHTIDAMEPHISPDGNALFYNSLNDGTTTSLYYASKADDTTFSSLDLMPTVNQTVTPRLDAVASLDTANNFYWVSTRNWPSNYYNLHKVKFAQGGPVNFGRVYGDIYIQQPGNIIMDACVNYHGNRMLYCNAYFNNCAFGLPCRSSIGFAQKVNDSTFNKMVNSGTLLANVNDTANYLVYAPFLTQDELELYFTRVQKYVAQTEICVSVRSTTTAPFGAPQVVIPMSSSAPEAVTLTTDKNRLYYHKKIGGVYKIFLRYRSGVTGITENSTTKATIFPNPSCGLVNIVAEGDVKCHLYDIWGRLLLAESSKTIDIKGFPGGVYYLKVVSGATSSTQKIVLSTGTN